MNHPYQQQQLLMQQLQHDQHMQAMNAQQFKDDPNRKERHRAELQRRIDALKEQLEKLDKEL